MIELEAKNSIKFFVWRTHTKKGSLQGSFLVFSSQNINRALFMRSHGDVGAEG
jgi:hypothetical protein